MALASQTVASVIRTYSRIVTPHPSPGQSWRQNRHRAFEFFSRVLKGEMNVPLRLPAHTYLHGVIRNQRGYVSRDVFTYVHNVVEARVKVHPRTFSHIIQPLIYVDFNRPPLGGTLASYNAAYRLLGLAFLHKIPHDLRLYHDLAERFLDSEKYFDAVMTYSALLMASRKFLDTSVDSSALATTSSSFTVSPEAAHKTIRELQVLICQHLLAKIKELEKLYQSHKNADSKDDKVDQLFARESKDAFQAVNELVRMTRKRESDIPSWNLYRLLYPLQSLGPLKPDIADGIGLVNNALGRVLSNQGSMTAGLRGDAFFAALKALVNGEASKSTEVSSSARTGSSTDEAVQLEESVAQLVSTAKSSKLKKLKGSQRGKKRPKVDETQDG